MCPSSWGLAKDWKEFRRIQIENLCSSIGFSFVVFGCLRGTAAASVQLPVNCNFNQVQASIT
jgi:hypothetical protein